MPTAQQFRIQFGYQVEVNRVHVTSGQIDPQEPDMSALAMIDVTSVLGILDLISQDAITPGEAHDAIMNAVADVNRWDNGNPFPAVSRV